MMKSSWELEIYGCDEITVPSTAVPCALLMDAELYDFTPTGSAADATCQQLADDHFASEVAGLSPTEFRKAITPVPTDNFAIDLDIMLRRVSSTVQRAAKHRAAIQQIVNGARSRLKKFETDDSAGTFDEIYDRIASGMEITLKKALILS